MEVSVTHSLFREKSVAIKMFRESLDESNPFLDSRSYRRALHSDRWKAIVTGSQAKQQATSKPRQRNPSLTYPNLQSL